jgi:RimJ/RimL family protein N-acetyltransferase
MGDPFELATPRLRLRPVREADVDALHALWTHPQVRRWLWDDVVIDRATAAERVAASAASFASARFGLWAICGWSGSRGARSEPEASELHEDGGGGLLGAAGLVLIEPAVGPEILYSLHPDHQGRGLATEAAQAVLAYAFEALALPRVPGRTDAPNRASARVLERLGMRFEGERLVNGNPHLCYALAREDWRRARSAPR